MADTWHAHRAVLRGTAAAVGVVLAASGLTAAPAHAGLLGVIAPEPGIDGIGSIDGPGSYVCSATTDVASVTQCSALPLSSLSLLEDTVLRAVETPGSGYAFGSWSGCPEPGGTVCTIPAGAIDGNLVTPIADFVPIPGGGEEPGTTPEVSITSWLPTESPTDATDASFQFSMAPVTEGWSFECQLLGPTSAHAWAPCVSGTSYADLEPGTYTFSVRATDGAAEPTLSNVDSQAWTVEEERVAAPASVVIDSGPLHKQWFLQDFAQFTYTAEPGDASVVCRLDGQRKQCTPSRILLRNLSGRTHTFTVAATDATGGSDRARRVFHVPKNNNTLRHSKGDWSQRSGKNYFQGTFSEADRRGSFVKAGAKKIKRIALVVTKGPGHGKVKVMLGKKVLKRVSLNAKKVRKSQLVPVQTFRKRKRGAVKVVVISRDKTVRIEGLGIASR